MKLKELLCVPPTKLLSSPGWRMTILNPREVWSGTHSSREWGSPPDKTCGNSNFGNNASKGGGASVVVQTCLAWLGKTPVLAARPSLAYIPLLWARHPRPLARMSLLWYDPLPALAPLVWLGRQWCGWSSWGVRQMLLDCLERLWWGPGRDLLLVGLAGTPSIEAVTPLVRTWTSKFT